MNKFIIIIIVVVIAGGGYWYWQKNQTAENENSSVEGTKTYQNNEHGFQFQYPSDWVVTSQASYIWFVMPDTKAFLEENARNCAAGADRTKCDPEALPGDITLSFESNLSAPEIMNGQSSVKHETIGGFDVSEYTLQEVYDDYHFEFKNNATVYNFSTTNTTLFSTIKQMIATLKSTK